jgi:hypothetical protein
MAVSWSRVATVKATIAFGETLFQWFVSDVINATVHIKNRLVQSEQKKKIGKKLKTKFFLRV